MGADVQTKDFDTGFSTFLVFCVSSSPIFFVCVKDFCTPLKIIENFKKFVCKGYIYQYLPY